MSQNHSTVPRLDLAPKLRRPLSLLNPLDYLLLLCWAFFFPQALRWYLDPLGRNCIFKGQITWQKAWKLLRQNSIQRQLILQGLTLSFLSSLLLYGFFYFIGIKFDGVLLVNFALFSMLVSIIIGLFSAWLIGQKYSVALGVASGVGAGVIFGVTWLPVNLLLKSMIFGALPSVASFIGSVVGSKLANTFEASLTNGILFGILFGTAWVVTLGIVSGVAFGLWHGWRFGLPLGMLICFWEAEQMGWISGLASGMAFGLGFALASAVTILRVENWLFALPFTLLSDTYSRLMPRVTPLPVVYLYSRLKNWLRQDWETGLHNANELLKYSLQFNTVINAISQVLSETPQKQLIFRVSKLAEAPYDWRLVEFVSKKLSLAANIDDFDDLKPPLNSTASAAVATTAFWYLYKAAEVEENRRSITKGYIQKAEKAFQLLRSLQYGEEMFTLTQTLATFASASEFASITFLQSPPLPKQVVVRELTWEAIACLNRVLEDAKAIQRSVSRSAKVFALNRALEELNSIQEKSNFLPQSEKILIAYIAQNWKECLEGLTSKVGEISITKPVCNPYVVGDPVHGKLFVGRGDILKQLEEFWILAQHLQSVLIYGHRRMGKSSIIRNIAQSLGSEIKVAYINLLCLGNSPQGAGEVLMAISDAISEAVNIPPPSDNELLNLPYRTFERYLKLVGTNLDNGLIIALDEFEKIEELIKFRKIENDFMGYLRGLVQMNPKIAFAFVGLHTLEEMAKDYFQPFFASVIAIKVSFLESAATYQLLENPTETFVLSYNSEALKKIYDLTSGQPYLVQLMGFLLIHRFNNQVFEQGLSHEPMFTVEDVEGLIKDPEFFKQGLSYFAGVWVQAAEGAFGQQTILRSIAPHPEGLSIDAIAQATNLDETTIQEALKTLKRHDVVEEKEGRWRIIVELFRRWVVNL